MWQCYASRSHMIANLQRNYENIEATITPRKSQQTRIAMNMLNNNVANIITCIQQERWCKYNKNCTEMLYKWRSRPHMLHLMPLSLHVKYILLYNLPFNVHALVYNCPPNFWRSYQIHALPPIPSIPPNITGSLRL